MLRDLLLLLMLRADWEPSTAGGGADSSVGGGGGGAGLASKLTVRIGRLRFSGRDISSARGTKVLAEDSAYTEEGGGGGGGGKEKTRNPRLKMTRRTSPASKNSHSYNTSV